MRKHYCGKCSLPVYFAELVQAAGRSWHTRCFLCANPECGRFMDSRSYNDHKEKLYCNHCYKYLFGPKGVGYGIGAGVLFTAGNKCKDSNDRNEFDDESIATASISYTDGRRKQTPGYIKFIDESFCDKSKLRYRNAANEKEDETIETGQSYLIPSLCSTNRKNVNVITNTSVICRRCSKEVYDAEKILAGGIAWHFNKCFVCEICKKLLEPRTVCVRYSVLYCNSCYARQFGPRGYGRGAGTGILQAPS
ncbi:Cysteine and glycine-rich protein [Dirofilaria immitis]